MKDDTARINRIILYCDRVEESIDNAGRDEGEFLEDWPLQYICSFCILQIGEIVKSLSPELTKRYPEIRWRGISGMRDIIAHGYDEISLSTLWFSINEEVPVLKTVCEKILREFKP